jgi:4-amino-4-deoxy-L-arabinose transferase-like glycosyltransferase
VWALPRLHWTHGLLIAGLIASGALYLHALDRVPAYLTLDEAHFSVHAASIAQTGRNLNGQILPPLISLEDREGEPFSLPWGSTYYLPFGIYLIAAALKVLPLTEAAVRTPSALLGGVINVALIFFVALALFRNRVAAFASAATMALAPANVIISRQALDSVCQPPFVLGALWCMASYLRTSNPRIALACGVIVGCGIYAYITSIVFMPFYLALFWFITWRGVGLDRRAIAWSIAGFAVALVPMGLWLLAHPEAARSLQLQYNRADPGSATLMQMLKDQGLAAAAAHTIHIYWSYFDPGFLFVQGGNARNLSTGETGVFVWAVGMLALIGIYGLRHDRRLQTLLLIGLLVSPIPAVIKGTPYAIQRASGVLIYTSLYAGIGFAVLWARPVALRAIAIALVTLTIWQFNGFYRDYHERYRIGSARAYDPTAFREIAELIFKADRSQPAAALYLPLNFYDVGAKWRFYTMKHDQPRLWRRTSYFADTTALNAAPASSLAVIPEAGSVGAVADGWRIEGVAKDLSGDTTAFVIRR